MKRFLSVLLALCMVLTLLPLEVFAAEIVDSGTCGENVTWRLDENGVLTISGEGRMMDYEWDQSLFYANTSISSVVIEPGVTDIGDYVFQNCGSLTNVVIPSSVTCIGDGAFWGCSNLTSVTIPESVTIIGEGAFCECSSLKSVMIPASVTAIGVMAFTSCSSMTEILVDKNNAVYKSDHGVLLNKGETEVIRCPGGKTGNYVIPDGVTIIREGAFSSCSGLTSVEIPVTVTSIGRSAFYCCSSLNGVEIPDGITDIRYMAFYCCSSLTSVVIPDGVTCIEDSAFSSCSSLTSVEIPTSVTSIGDAAFLCCSSLTSVTIPDSVISIGSYAFCGCSSLKSVMIPASVTSIGNYALSNCGSLTVIKVDKYNTAYKSDHGVLLNEAGTELICCPAGKTEGYVIPAGVTSIGVGAFACSSLTSVEIPTSVTSIGDAAFSDCSSLTNVTISSSVTSIGTSAFANCNSLDNVLFHGTESEWNEISIGSDNEPLKNATKFFRKLIGAREATCTSTGYTGDLYQNLYQSGTSCWLLIEQGSVIPATGHSWGDWVLTKEASASAPGVETRTCTVCGETETREVLYVAPLEITAQPQDYVGKLNSTATFTVAAEGDGLTYQWQISDDGENWTNSSVKRAVYTTKLTAARDGRQVRCVVTDANGTKVTSAVATMKLSGPVITTQPKDYTGKLNSTATFTVAAEGNGLAYQWQLSDDNGATWTNSSVKRAAYTSKLTADKDGRQVRCIVTNAEGGKVTSEVATMKLAGPDITTQPKDYTGKLNSTASFSVAATGDGLTYQWQISDDNGATWTNSSVKKAVYTTKLTDAKNGRQVRCIVTDANGNKATSAAATMRLAGPVITSQPKNYVGKVNSTASFTVVAEGNGLSYQWQISDNDGDSWTNSSVKKAVYTSKLTTAKDGRMVRCVVTDADGNSVTSNDVTMRIG